MSFLGLFGKHDKHDEYVPYLVDEVILEGDKFLIVRDGERTVIKTEGLDWGVLFGILRVIVTRIQKLEEGKR
jgi:hypothetical protein